MTGSEGMSGPDILDLVHDSIIVRDMEGRILQWNSAAESQYGWTRDEAVGRDLREILDCRNSEALDSVEAEVLATGRWEGEFERVTRDGREIRIDARWSLSRDPGGRPLRIVETGRDITEKRASEEAVRLNEYRFRNLFQAMAVAFWEIDFRGVGELLIPLREQGVTDLRAHLLSRPELVRRAMRHARVLDVNERTLALFRAGREDIIGGDVERFWPEASFPVFVESLVGAMEKHPNLVTETKLLDARGEEIDVLFTVSWSAESRREGVILLGIIDIGDRKRAFEALARSELKYRNLFHHMPLSLCQLDVSELVGILGRLRGEGVADLDAYMDEHPDFLGGLIRAMRVEQVNEQTVRLFGGRDPSEFVGPIAQFWRGSEDTVRRSLVARYAGAETYSEETRMQTLDGRAIDVFYTSAFPPPLSEAGIGLVGIIDVGDRLAAERMLQQVQADFAHAARVATLGELTASIAHEVNQPLAAIATNGEASLRWLDRPEPDVEEVRVLAGRMVADARRAADVIGHIRTMATRHVPERESLSVNEVIAETLGFLRREFQARDVGVTFNPAADLPPAVADRTQLQQVVVNLAVNAVQAMAQRGGGERRLTVRTLAAAGGRIRVEVEDSGPGIRPDDLRRLFESFYTTKRNGLGLGLSICRSIVQAHGGEIGCEDTGSGALFSFTLPAQDSPLIPTYEKASST